MAGGNKAHPNHHFRDRCKGKFLCTIDTCRHHRWMNCGVEWNYLCAIEDELAEKKAFIFTLDEKDPLCPRYEECTGCIDCHNGKGVKSSYEIVRDALRQAR